MIYEKCLLTLTGNCPTNSGIKYTENDRNYWDFDNQNKPTNILQTSVGYEALLRILVDLINYESLNVENLKETTFTPYLEKALEVNLEDQKTFPFSTKGKNILYTTMSLKIWPNLPFGQDDKRREYLNSLRRNL